MATPIPLNRAAFTVETVVAATRGVVVREGAAAGVGVTTDSRAVREGGIFVALKGESHDGHAFVGAAVKNGAAIVVVERGRGGEAVEGVTGEDVASLRTAREVRDATLEAYKKGTKDLVDALDSEKAYRDRVRNTLGNLTDYWQALNRLNAAVGQRVLTAVEAEKDTLLDEATPKK